MAKFTVFKFECSLISRYEEDDELMPPNRAEVVEGLAAAKETAIMHLNEEIARIRQLKLKDIQ